MFVFPPACVPSEVRYEINEMARFLLELSVIDYYFIIHRPSDVALAATMNAIEAVCGPDALPTLAGFASELARLGDGTLLDPHRQQVLECRSRLQILYNQGGYSRNDLDSPSMSTDAVEGTDRNDAFSPVCVSQHGLDIHQAQSHSIPTADAAGPMGDQNCHTIEQNNKLEMDSVSTDGMTSSEADDNAGHHIEPIAIES
jgi:Cyclin, C-terminal domain